MSGDIPPVTNRVLDYVKYDPSSEAKRTVYNCKLIEVVNVFIQYPEWQELYGLTLAQTMELDYSHFQYLIQRIITHKEQLKQAKILLDEKERLKMLNKSQ